VLKKPFVETSEAEYDSMFAINSKAAYFFIQEAGKRMNDGGKIVTIVTSLLAAFTGLYSTYAGSKAPVEHFTRAAAKEFGPRGISVNNVAPGPMDTPFFYPAESPESIAYHKAASMNGKLTEIRDIAPIVKFLVTEGWWITGQTIFANGGYTTR
jgi:NAD(P)-dependent dehydrogenase (short-subunit alcohol dehydrogenase family)